MADSVSTVIAEIVAGDTLTLNQAAKLIPAHRGEGTATVSRIWRWASAGFRREDGRVVKLETARFGTQILTSRAALARFATALTSPSEAAPLTPPARSPAAQLKAAEAAAKRLADAGA
jgi:hypothetical protein